MCHAVSATSWAPSDALSAPLALSLPASFVHITHLRVWQVLAVSASHSIPKDQCTTEMGLFYFGKSDLLRKQKAEMLTNIGAFILAIFLFNEWQELS